MRELNVSEMEDVNGGIVALYWVGVGAVHAYRTYKTARFIGNSVGGGLTWDLIKKMF